MAASLRSTYTQSVIDECFRGSRAATGRRAAIKRPALNGARFPRSASFHTPHFGSGGARGRDLFREQPCQAAPRLPGPRHYLTFGKQSHARPDRLTH